MDSHLSLCHTAFCVWLHGHTFGPYGEWPCCWNSNAGLRILLTALPLYIPDVGCNKPSGEDQLPGGSALLCLVTGQGTWLTVVCKYLWAHMWESKFFRRNFTWNMKRSVIKLQHTSSLSHAVISNQDGVLQYPGANIRPLYWVESYLSGPNLKGFCLSTVTELFPTIFLSKEGVCKWACSFCVILLYYSLIYPVRIKEKKNITALISTLIKSVYLLASSSGTHCRLKFLCKPVQLSNFTIKACIFFCMFMNVG